jgi:hypothetical protein
MIQWAPGLTLESVEQMIIVQAIKFYGGNKTKTADSLGIAIRTLDNKLEKYDADRRDAASAAERERKNREEWLHKHRASAQKIDGLSSPDSGTRVEPVIEVTAKPKVSMPQRAQVQEVLPRQVAQGNKPKGR